MESSHYPLLSVLMSVHNGRTYLREAIDSVLAQTLSDFELLIIDDASSDDSLRIVKSYADQRIKTIENHRNLGLTASLNAGLRQARGEWIVRLDADDSMALTRLQHQLHYVKQHRCSVCFAQATIRDETNGTETVWRQPPWPIVVWSSLFSNGYGLHPSVMFRRSRVLELGGYDETFAKAQDYELFDRLCAAGEVFGYVDEPLIIYRRHDQQISMQRLGEQEQCARRVSFRAMRRYLPELTDGTALQLRWLFLSRENRPVSVPVTLVDVASDLLRAFLQVAAHRGFGCQVYQVALSALAHRYYELGSPGLKKSAWRLAGTAAMRTRDLLLPLRWVRWLYANRRSMLRSAFAL